MLVKHTYTKAMCRKDGGLKTFPLFVPPSSIIFLSFLCNGVERRRLGLRLNAQECTFKAKMEEGFMYTFLPQGISPNVFKFHSEMNLLFITRDVIIFSCTVQLRTSSISVFKDKAANADHLENDIFRNQPSRFRFANLPTY